MGRVVLCLVDNFLGVVQQEGAKLKRRTIGWAKLLKYVKETIFREGNRKITYQDKATIDSNAVHSSPQSSGGWKEVGGNAGAENHTQSHGERPAHVEELVAGGADSDSGQATDHARGVPGSPGQDWSAEQADGSNDSANNSTVCKPGSLLGTNSRSVGDAASDHAAPNHGCNAHSHGDHTTPVNLRHHCFIVIQTKLDFVPSSWQQETGR